MGVAHLFAKEDSVDLIRDLLSLSRRKKDIIEIIHLFSNEFTGHIFIPYDIDLHVDIKSLSIIFLSYTLNSYYNVKCLLFVIDVM